MNKIRTKGNEAIGGRSKTPHATRKRIGGHKHYPIFAVRNSSGKNPGNVWEIAHKEHYGNEHFVIDKFNIFDILKRFLRYSLYSMVYFGYTSFDHIVSLYWK